MLLAVLPFPRGSRGLEPVVWLSPLGWAHVLHFTPDSPGPHYTQVHYLSGLGSGASDFEEVRMELPRAHLGQAEHTPLLICVRVCFRLPGFSPEGAM